MMSKGSERALVATVLFVAMCIGQCDGERVVDHGTFSDGSSGGRLRTDCAPETTVTLTVQVMPVEQIAGYYGQLTGAASSSSYDKVEGFWLQTTKRHLIVVPEIDRQNDRYLDVWGHELAHVACGLFH